MGGNNSQGGYDPAGLGQELGSRLQSATGSLPSSFGPAYTPPSRSTTQALDTLEYGSNNPTYQAGAGGALTDFADIAAGKRFGMNDPGYATLRGNVANDATTAANSLFNSTGRFGASSHAKAVGEGVGNALAGLDYANYGQDQARQMQAAAFLPQTLQNTLLPSQTQLGVGALRDANNSTQNSAEFDRFLAILNANNASQGSAGMQPQPQWWQIAGGLGSVGAGILGSFL